MNMPRTWDPDSVAVVKTVKSWSSTRKKGAFILVPRSWIGEEVVVRLDNTRIRTRGRSTSGGVNCYVTVKPDWVGKEVVATLLEYDPDKPARSVFAERFRQEHKKKQEEVMT